MKLSKGKISKIRNKNKQSHKKNKKGQDKRRGDTFRKRKSLNLNRKTLKHIRNNGGGEDDEKKTSSIQEDIPTKDVQEESSPVQEEFSPVKEESSPVQEEFSPVKEESFPVQEASLEPEIVDTKIEEPEIVDTKIEEPEIVDTKIEEPEIEESKMEEPEIVDTKIEEPAFLEKEPEIENVPVQEEEDNVKPMPELGTESITPVDLTAEPQHIEPSMNQEEEIGPKVEETPLNQDKASLDEISSLFDAYLKNKINQTIANTHVNFEPGNVQNGISSVSTAMETTRNASGGKRRRKRTFKKR